MKSIEVLSEWLLKYTVLLNPPETSLKVMDVISNKHLLQIH